MDRFFSDISIFFIICLTISLLIFGNLYSYYPIYGETFLIGYTFMIMQNVLKIIILMYVKNIKNTIYISKVLAFTSSIPEKTFSYLPYIIILFFVYSICNILKDCSQKYKFLVVFSTPFILAIQRANNEMIIFILIFLFLFFRKRKYFISYTLLLFKFFKILSICNIFFYL